MSVHEDSISNSDFDRLRSLIYSTSGITLSPEKKTMLELRVKRRLRSLHLESYAAYCAYLFGGHNQKEEIVHLIDAVSTNKTDFFREPEHFEFLVQRALPGLVAGDESGRPLRIWSAGCSTGEEPYTLAMVLHERGPDYPGFRFQVLATDISTAVLTKAERGVFSLEALSPVPEGLRRKYFMRSRNPETKLLRVVPELRSLIEFRRLNFMDADFGLRQPVNVIFCRNVMIYFDRPTQERILQKLAAQVVPGGYVFVGHSETLHDMDVPLTAVAPAVYRKPGRN
ncbi:MAG: protein-glutamate O-methyltransferase CheR [Terriglobales bacterium]